MQELDSYGSLASLEMLSEAELLEIINDDDEKRGKDAGKIVNRVQANETAVCLLKALHAHKQAMKLLPDEDVQNQIDSLVDTLRTILCL